MNTQTFVLNQLVFASTNLGKIKELKIALKNYVHEIISQVDLNFPDIPETGTTFKENAIIKAQNACNYTNFPSVADDSGLCIDALDGQPGIYSARYAGQNCKPEDNIKLVLKNLKGVPMEKRTAHFVTSIALVKHKNDPSPVVFEEKYSGIILTERSGTNGFGYDPIFYLPSHNTTLANLSAAEKISISARGKALKKLVNYFKNEQH